jgi:hypothetical protein
MSVEGDDGGIGEVVGVDVDVKAMKKTLSTNEAAGDVENRSD